MPMLCPSCGKESNNLRVCAFCQTPYPTDRVSQGATPRFTRSVGVPGAQASGDPRIGMARRARTRRWAGIGVLAVFTIGFYFVTRDRVIPVGVALPNLITIPMSPNDAARMIKTYEGSTQADSRAGGAVTVRVPEKSFPERRDGQLALAQQYARADEIVMGHKRLINFIDPNGIPFAKADPASGVVLTR
jgi:hypothetical protein